MLSGDDGGGGGGGGKLGKYDQNDVDHFLL